MSQFDFGVIQPSTTTGTELATILENWRDAVNSSHLGTTRPTYVKQGQIWVQVSSSTRWVVNLFDGVNDIPLGTVNPVNDTTSFSGRSTVQTNAGGASITLSQSSTVLGIVGAANTQLNINLPAAAAAGDGFRFTVQKRDSTNGILSINALSQDNINGSLSFILRNQYDNVTLVSDGINSWYAITALPDSVITTTKIAAAAVTTAKIADANITTAKLADGSVTAAKLASGVIAGRLLRAPQILTSGTQYTAPTDCTSIYVEAVGGGGAGGGAATSGGNGYAGAGGGSGAYSAKLFPVTGGSTYTYAVGSGGTGTAGAAGTAGTASTFTVAGVTISAGGGNGGGQTTTTTISSWGQGGLGGTATGGDININGANGGPGIGSSTSSFGLYAGAGGAAAFGGAGVTRNYNSAGSAGSSGGGGSGASSVSATSALAGGAGGAGFIRVWEFA